MRRDLWMALILGCLLVLLLEAPAALSSLSGGLRSPYEILAAPPAPEVPSPHAPHAPRPPGAQSEEAGEAAGDEVPVPVFDVPEPESYAGRFASRADAGEHGASAGL